MLRVVEFVARNKSSVLAATASLFNKCLASIAFIIMAFRRTLMPLTRKEFLTNSVLADRNSIGAFLSLFAKKLPDFLSTARAE